MKFAEMPYQRVDTEAVVAALKELTQELKAAKSGEEQFEIHQKFYALRDEYNTTIQIAMIRSDVDTADEFYSEEKNYYNEVLPTINNQETEYRKALYYSPYREVLEEKIADAGGKCADNTVCQADCKCKDRLGRGNFKPVFTSSIYDS